MQPERELHPERKGHPERADSSAEQPAPLLLPHLAVRVVARGEVLFGAGIAARMLQHFGRAATSSPFPELNERETEVLGLLAAGPGQRWGREALGGQSQDGA